MPLSKSTSTQVFSEMYLSTFQVLYKLYLSTDVLKYKVLLPSSADDQLYSRRAIYNTADIFLLIISFLYSLYLPYRVWCRLSSLDISLILLVPRGLNSTAWCAI